MLNFNCFHFKKYKTHLQLSEVPFEAEPVLSYWQHDGRLL